MKYANMTKEEQRERLAALRAQYDTFRAMGLSLNLSRGKPSAEQLDLCSAVYDAPIAREELFGADGFDYRNYGLLEGIPEARRFFAGIFGVGEENVFVGGNSSLQMMFDTLSRAMLFGVVGSPRPWCMEEKRKWICVVPGYDRHFRITETFGFELLCVPMTKDGPDMDEVERLVKDPAVKGIWCVPKYSNPTGNTYSDETVRRLASMECAAPDFRIFWDNAYAIHDLYEEGDALADIFALAREAGNENRIFAFASTSKITLPGAGVAAMAMSAENMKAALPILGAQTIGADKVNMVRNLRIFREPGALHAHMMKLAERLRRKFAITLSALAPLSEYGIAEWTEPKGGYFISLDCMPGTAKRVYALMKDAGITLTQVGATFPYGVDPEDKNLRLAPSYPTEEELTLGCRVLSDCVQIAALEKLLGE